MVVVHPEICVGLDHPIVTQLLESNSAVYHMKYDVSKGVCRSKQCKMTIPIVESRAVQDGWRRRTKRVSGWQCDKCANASSNLYHFTEELRKNPISISATTESLADVIKKLHYSHNQREIARTSSVNVSRMTHILSIVHRFSSS